MAGKSKPGRRPERRVHPRRAEGLTALSVDHEDPRHGWVPKAIKWFRVGCLGLTKAAFADLFDPPSSDRQIRRWETGSHIPNRSMIEQLDAMAREVYFEPRKRMAAIEQLELLGELDGYSKDHSLRVAEFSVWIARLLGMSRKERAVIGEAGLLHDIGKISISQRILKKPGALTPDEYAEMKRHVTHSENLALVYAGQQVASIVAAHHERMDGSGYPLGTTQIPLASRILAVADTFEAMTAYRQYRTRRFTPLEVVETLKSPAFDQEIAGVWLEMVTKNEAKVMNISSRMMEILQS